MVFLFIIHSIFYYVTGEAVECYQCDSNEDGIQCPADERFDTYINAPVDCNGFEAHTPGQFCMKITQESPGCEYLCYCILNTLFDILLKL